MRYARLILCALLLLWLPVVFAADAVAPKPLVIGIFPYLSANVVIKRFLPLRDYLETHLGQPVQLYTAPNFKTFVQRTEAGEFDVILTAPHFAWLAQTESGYIPLATTQAELRGLLVVSTRSPIAQLADLRGKTVAIPDRLALIPMMGLQLLRKSGLQPERDFQVRVTRSHDSAALAVQHGSDDAAIVGSASFSQFPESLRGSLRVLAATESIPSRYYLAHTRLGTAQIERIRTLLLQFAAENSTEKLRASTGEELNKLSAFAQEAKHQLTLE